MVEIPELEGWSTAPQVAKHFGVSRQRVNQWILEGKFPLVHRIGEILILPESDIDTFAERRGRRAVHTEVPASVCRPKLVQEDLYE